MIRTLMRDLEDGPLHFVLLFAFVAGVFGVFHLVGELEEGVFEVVEAIWRRLAVLRGADGGHGGGVDADVRVSSGRPRPVLLVRCEVDVVVDVAVDVVKFYSYGSGAWSTDIGVAREEARDLQLSTR